MVWFKFKSENIFDLIKKIVKRIFNFVKSYPWHKRDAKGAKNQPP